MSQHRKGQPQHVAGWGTPLFGSRMLKQIQQLEVEGQELGQTEPACLKVSPGEPLCLSQGSLPDSVWELH